MSETPNLGAMLGKRLGPLPVGGWAAAILGGLGISYYLRRNGTGGTPNPVEYDTACGAATGGLGGAALSDPANPGNISDAPEDTGPPTTGYGIATNAQWRVQAVKYLVGGGSTGINAENAVGSYLAGRALSLAQAQAVNRAIAGIGPTPAAVPAIRITPTPAAVQTAPKAPPKAPPKKKKKKHTPIRHKSHPTHKQHAHKTAHPNHRRDTGRGINP